MFNAFSLVSNKVSSVVATVIGTVENIINKLIMRNKDKEMESDLDE